MVERTLTETEFNQEAFFSLDSFLGPAHIRQKPIE